MSESYYTLTIHIAEGGTPRFNARRKVWEDAKDTSTAGHMWYSLQKGGEGQDEKGALLSYGFEPEGEKSGPRSAPGEVSTDDIKIYHQPLYERTMEISKEQYDSLMEFGQDGKNKEWMHGFESKYHALTNSCVDFTWGALKHAGLEWDLPAQFHGPNVDSTPAYRGPINGHFEGDLTPRDNRDEIDKLIDPIPGSKHNRTRHGPPAKEVSAGLRRERAAAFRENPKAALEQFPEYGPLHAANEALDTVSEKFSGKTRRGDAMVAKMHRHLANRLEQGASIPSPQQAFGMVSLEMRRISHGQGY